MDRRKPRLKRERFTDLTSDEMQGMVAAGVTSVDTACITALVAAIMRAANEATTNTNGCEYCSNSCVSAGCCTFTCP